MDLLRMPRTGTIHKPGCKQAKTSCVKWKYGEDIVAKEDLTALSKTFGWLHLCVYCFPGLCSCKACLAKKPRCTKESGTCAQCQSYCQHKPGWFLPGEAEKAAEYLELPLAEFFQKYLAIDWWQRPGQRDIFLLSPAITSSPPGQEFPGEPRGTCVFFQEGRCQIHPVKPAECKDAVCTSTENSGIHRRIAGAWDTPEAQAQVVKLLGREPESEEYDSGGLHDLFSRLFF